MRVRLESRGEEVTGILKDLEARQAGAMSLKISQSTVSVPRPTASTVQRNEPSRVGAAAVRGTLGRVNNRLVDVPSIEAQAAEQGGLEFDNDIFVDELAIRSPCKHRLGPHKWRQNRSMGSQNNPNAGHPHAELAPHDTSSPVTPDATKRLLFLFQHLSTFSYYFGKFSLVD
ncbi:hypothetical protein BDP55DRAFT_637238 [Colletotrichum godetiae]|uniref:Uncharacterized protein n=1 Tax=Colletotrichum godetiae TaxID=1209918 RepID=A0AAJ0A9J7_9PEZI|nr:uncharacterized protein BDP55DRAFT_637238 [Colletotrichum godetiae]KAK1659046.1 hypothetical protein BDP55DRAFT_637238 [Colletotrichum godetiae]